MSIHLLEEERRIIPVGGGTPDTWDSTYNTANITYSNGDMTVTKTWANHRIFTAARGTAGKSSGQHSFEVQCTSAYRADAVIMLGVTIVPHSDVTNLTGFWGAAPDYGVAYYFNTGLTYHLGGSNDIGMGVGALNDYIGVVWDADAGTVRFFRNNVDKGVAFSGLSGTLYIAMSMYESSDQLVLETDPNNFNQSNLPTHGWYV